VTEQEIAFYELQRIKCECGGFFICTYETKYTGEVECQECHKRRRIDNASSSKET